MARVFTLSFQFEGRPCSALVNLRDKGYDLSFFVHYLNKEVSHILPDGNLSFSLTEGLQQPASLVSEPAFRLVNSTMDAIANFLKRDQE